MAVSAFGAVPVTAADGTDEKVTIHFAYWIAENDTLDEAGLEIPDLTWTWEVYAEYAKKLTKEEDGKKRYGSVDPFWGDPVLKEWLEYKYQLENVDRTEISYVDYTTSNLNYNAEFFNGSAAMLVTGMFALPYITNLETYPHDFQTVVTIAPKWSTAENGVERDASPILAINKNADESHKEAAYNFIKFYTREGLLMRNLVPSYKDVDYEKLTDSLVNGQENLIDREWLLKYFSYDKRHLHSVMTTPDSNTELQGILKEEGDKYLSDAQNIDETSGAG